LPMLRFASPGRPEFQARSAATIERAVIEDRTTG
jgi:hypothetical protein